jgi:phosphoribosylformimino-5-aminoimidazole carboxamide ribotide isomerase
MLIPSIDLRRGKVVQLVQGERLALERDDLDAWIERFRSFPRVQVIDLDAAMNDGTNRDLVGYICERLPCRVGGGIRTPDEGRRVLDLGAQAVIVGSAFVRAGRVVQAVATEFAVALGAQALIAAVDSRRGSVVVDGWRTSSGVKTVDAIRTLEPFCGEFLYTHVDTEGLMHGIDMEAVGEVRRATARRIAAAGGITTRAEIDALDRLGVDAVVGMAIYTGTLELDEPLPPDRRPTHKRGGA